METIIAIIVGGLCGTAIGTVGTSFFINRSDKKREAKLDLIENNLPGELPPNCPKCNASLVNHNERPTHHERMPILGIPEHLSYRCMRCSVSLRVKPRYLWDKDLAALQQGHTEAD